MKLDRCPAGIGCGEFLQFKTILDREIRRSNLGCVVYVPKSVDGSAFDNGNEHFLVFEAPDASLMTVWTQSTAEGAGDYRIVFSRSPDGGIIWSTPLRIAGPARKGEGNQASWGFAALSKSGRLYVIYNQYQGVSDDHPQVTGSIDCVYSDDAGRTWSKPGTIPPAAADRHPRRLWELLTAAQRHHTIVYIRIGGIEPEHHLGGQH